MMLGGGGKKESNYFSFALILLYYAVGDIGTNKLNLLANNILEMLGNWF